jgi:hypothetical protein
MTTTTMTSTEQGGRLAQRARAETKSEGGRRATTAGLYTGDAGPGRVIIHQSSMYLRTLGKMVAGGWRGEDKAEESCGTLGKAAGDETALFDDRNTDTDQLQCAYKINRSFWTLQASEPSRPGCDVSHVLQDGHELALLLDLDSRIDGFFCSRS